MPALIATFHPDTFNEFFEKPLKDFPTLAEDLMADIHNVQGFGKASPAIWKGCALHAAPRGASRSAHAYSHHASPGAVS